MTERRDGWGFGSYRLATITGLIFLAGMYYLVYIDHPVLAAACALAAGGNFMKAGERAKHKRLAKYEQRLENLMRK